MDGGSLAPSNHGLAPLCLKTHFEYTQLVKALEQAFPRFADDLTWWVEAGKAQRQRPPREYSRRIVNFAFDHGYHG
jgi:hypothetical protein